MFRLSESQNPSTSTCGQCARPLTMNHPAPNILQFLAAIVNLSTGADWKTTSLAYQANTKPTDIGRPFLYPASAEGSIASPRSSNEIQRKDARTPGLSFSESEAASFIGPPTPPSTEILFEPLTGPNLLPRAVSKAKDLTELVGEYSDKLHNTLHLKNKTEKRFASPSSAGEILNSHELGILFQALIESNEGSTQVKGEEARWDTCQVIDMVNGNKNGGQLHNILATLLYARCKPNDLLHFISRYIRPVNELPTDEDLPLTEDSALDFCPKRCGRLFLDHQSIFAPLRFREEEENMFLKKDGQPTRLPVLRKKTLDGGSGGEVFAVEIARGCWRYPNGDTNTKSIWVAQKVYRGNRIEEAQSAFRKELDIFKQAGQSPTRHKNVLLSLGSLEQQDNYSIFMPLACCNLEHILTGDLPDIGSNPAPDPNITSPTRPQLLERTAGFCEGLHHLHCGITQKCALLSIYHRDVCPKNILVLDDGFKISDLGLSEVKKRAAAGELPPWTADRRGDGTFSSPESKLQKRVSSVSDVWAAGCVVLEVFARVIGGTRLLKQFREERCRLDSDQFFILYDGQAFMNPLVIDWCQDLRALASTENDHFGVVISSALDFLEEKVLLIDCNLRMKTSAAAIATMLYETAEKLRKPPVTIRHTLAQAQPSMQKRSISHLICSYWSRKLSSWSVLLALLSSQEYGGERGICFAPGWKHWLSMSKDNRKLEVHLLPSARPSSLAISVISNERIQCFDISISHLIISTSTHYFNCDMHDLSTGQSTSISLPGEWPLHRMALSRDGEGVVFITRNPLKPSQSRLHCCTLKDLQQFTQHDGDASSGSPFPLADVMHKRFANSTQRVDDSHFKEFWKCDIPSAQDASTIIRLANGIAVACPRNRERNGEYTVFWNKKIYGHGSIQPLEDMEGMPENDQLKSIALLHHCQDSYITFFGSGIIRRHDADETVSTLSTGLDIEEIFVTDNDKHLIVLARSPTGDDGGKGQLRAWRIKVKNIEDEGSLIDMGLLGVEVDDDIVDTAFSSGKLFRPHLVRLLTKDGKVVEARFW